jgi:hypothetical protein
MLAALVAKNRCVTSLTKPGTNMAITVFNLNLKFVAWKNNCLTVLQQTHSANPNPNRNPNPSQCIASHLVAITGGNQYKMKQFWSLFINYLCCTVAILLPISTLYAVLPLQ